MNIYLLTRIDKCGYDQYDSQVVAAETEEAARTTHPCHIINYEWDENESCWVYGEGKYKGEKSNYTSWTNDINSLHVEALGESDYSNARVILASFNAG